MKKTTKKSSEEISMNAPNHMAILAILTEMVRHLNGEYFEGRVKTVARSVYTTCYG